MERADPGPPQNRIEQYGTQRSYEPIAELKQEQRPYGPPRRLTGGEQPMSEYCIEQVIGMGQRPYVRARLFDLDGKGHAVPVHIASGQEPVDEKREQQHGARQEFFHAPGATLPPA